MNTSLRPRSIIAVMVAALIVGVLAIPKIASVWNLNLANAAVARAAALPSDGRAAAIAQAETLLARANSIDTPRLALTRARLALLQNKSQLAIDALAQAEASVQSDFIAQFLWGDAAWRLRQSNVAYEHWRAAGAIEYFTQQMFRASQSHAWQSSVENARIALGIEPQHAYATYLLADALSQQNIDDPEIFPLLDRAATLTSDKEFLSTILSRQGELLAARGHLSDALALFQQARAVAPIDARPRVGYALASLKLDPSKFDASVDLLKQVVNDSPWYTAAYIALADLLESRGDQVGAEQWLKQGLTKNSNAPDVLFALGKFYARQNRIGDARTSLTQALKYETHSDDLQAIAHALAGLP